VLDQEFETTGPNQIGRESSYVRMAEGWLNLAIQLNFCVHPAKAIAITRPC
jgi:hypothetical protein